MESSFQILVCSLDIERKKKRKYQLKLTLERETIFIEMQITVLTRLRAKRLSTSIKYEIMVRIPPGTIRNRVLSKVFLLVLYFLYNLTM